MVNIYAPEGWLDIPRIVQMTPEACFYVLVGSRRTGKTYGVIDWLHEQQANYIFMRLTSEELDYTISDTVNFYEGNGFPWSDSMHISGGKLRIIYDDNYKDGKLPVAKAMALSDVSKIRGYGAQECTDIVLDEFIPEISAYNKPHTGSALFNAYLTINGTRELPPKNQPPCRLWLLSNSNALNNDILRFWDFLRPLMTMQRKGQEFYYNPGRRLCIINVAKSPISAALAQTALFQCTGADSAMAKMALENSFLDQDDSGVGSQPLREYTAELMVDKLALCRHKSRRGVWYIYQPPERMASQIHRRYKSSSPTSRAAFVRWWRVYGNNAPVDGRTMYYNTYEDKLLMHRLLNIK